MNKLIRFSQILLLLLFLTGCKTEANKETLIKDSEDQQSDKVVEKSRMEIRVSCGKGELAKFLNDGWIIAEESSEEKICSWKSFPASKECDIEKDKGCKITMPDKIGEEKIYLLEK